MKTQMYSNSTPPSEELLGNEFLFDFFSVTFECFHHNLSPYQQHPRINHFKKQHQIFMNGRPTLTVSQQETVVTSNYRQQALVNFSLAIQSTGYTL